MTRRPVLEREEYIEQAYLFRVLRERMSEEQATQDLLARVDQEILSTTRLPYAIQFLAAEVKHTGLLSSGFARLSHYFTPFQAFVIQGTEEESRRFSLNTALLVLQREAEYRAGNPTPQGLFVYQFEVLSRNRLGYDGGLKCMADDVLYDVHWSGFIASLRAQLGLVDFADLIYLRSQLYIKDQERIDPAYAPPLAPLFSEKEGKIAKANRQRDPLYLFSTLQRQLNYPEVPRPAPPDDLRNKMLTIEARYRELEQRLRLLESETRAQVDLSQFGKPEILKDDDEE
jgi:hypothetical protein